MSDSDSGVMHAKDALHMQGHHQSNTCTSGTLVS